MRVMCWIRDVEGEFCSGAYKSKFSPTTYLSNLTRNKSKNDANCSVFQAKWVRKGEKSVNQKGIILFFFHFSLFWQKVVLNQFNGVNVSPTPFLVRREGRTPLALRPWISVSWFFHYFCRGCYVGWQHGILVDKSMPSPFFLSGIFFEKVSILALGIFVSSLQNYENYSLPSSVSSYTVYAGSLILG